MLSKYRADLCLEERDLRSLTPGALSECKRSSLFPIFKFSFLILATIAYPWLMYGILSKSFLTDQKPILQDGLKER